MNKQFISILIPALAVCTLLSAQSSKEIRKGAAAPVDSVLSVEELCTRSTVTDSTLLGTVRTATAAAEAGVDSIGTYTSRWQVTRQEDWQRITTRQTYKSVEVIDPNKPDSLRTGHYLRASLGCGYGFMGARSSSNSFRNGGQLGGLFHLEYLYFFHPSVGVSIGLGASTHGGCKEGSYERTWLDQTDSNGERYDHTATARNWHESARLWDVDVPLALQFQKYWGQKPWGIYGNLGVVMSLPVSKTYRLIDGEVEHTGYYRPWHLTLRNWRDFYTERVGEELSDQRQQLPLKSLQAQGKVELGAMYALSPQWDLLLGVYGCVTMNNMQQEQTPLAWMHTEYAGDEAYKNHRFMEHEYRSVLASDEVRAVRPWQVGIKVGVQWRHVDRRTHSHTEYEPLVVRDTLLESRPRTYEVETYQYDTVMTPTEEIRRLMDKSIIWFDMNSSEPKLNPSDFLDRIAEVMKAHPELRCEVNGHTCTIGSRSYNQKLSEKRAKAVADRLIELGVRPEQLECHGYCSDKPYYSESHQLFLDRRCEIIPIESTNEQKIIHRETKGKH